MTTPQPPATPLDTFRKALTDAADECVADLEGRGVSAETACAAAGEVVFAAVKAFGEADQVIRADERQKVYAELGHDHYVIFTADGWTSEHSIGCRLSGRMHECEIHRQIGEWATEQPRLSGRWRVVDAAGTVPVLERAEPIKGDDQ